MAVVTISRQYGSLGEEVAFRVCELLGYRYFDKRLMEQLAGELSRASGKVVDLSEDNYHVRSTLERLLHGGANRPDDPCRSWVEEGPGGLRLAEWVNLDEEKAISLVQNYIQAAYRLGKVVILGRGGQLVLKGQPDVLHVRIHAPVEHRVETVVQHCMITHAEAREVINRKDRAASEYLRRFCGGDCDDLSLYHLIIDSSKIGVETAAEMVTAAAKRMETQGEQV